MKPTKAKFFTTLMTCFLVCLMFVTPVLAATNFFSKTTVKLNALGGGESKTSAVTSGSVTGSNPSITQVKVYLNVGSGSDPFEVCIVSPSGKEVYFTPSTKNATYTLKDFNGENPSGTWKVHIINSGFSYNPNQIIPTSTATATLTVTYSY